MKDEEMNGKVIMREDLRCIKCGCGGNMMKFAHTNEQDKIVGFIYACKACCLVMAKNGMRISIEEGLPLRDEVVGVKRPEIINLN